MKRSFVMMICIAVIATATGCNKSDPIRLDGPQVAQPIEDELQRRNDPSLIPYTVILGKL